jgi:hypothetical protein
MSEKKCIPQTMGPKPQRCELLVLTPYQKGTKNILKSKNDIFVHASHVFEQYHIHFFVIFYNWIFWAFICSPIKIFKIFTYSNWKDCDPDVIFEIQIFPFPLQSVIIRQLI